MAHTIRIDGTVQAQCNAWSRPESGLRVFPTAAGDMLVLTAANGEATRDGVPMLGDVTIVRWGHSAVLRLDGRKIEVSWRASGERRHARVGEECRLCFGAFGDEDVVCCSCLAAFHPASCDVVRNDCPSCGMPREDVES